jgi:MGT family glycosyltransferase
MIRNLHIAFFSIAHPPHVNPTLPIVSALVRRGYRVTYVTSEAFSSRVGALGAEVLSCRSYDHAASDRVKSPEHNPKLLAANMNGVCELAVRTLAEITPFYERNRPDLIIYDLVAFAGRILANRWKIPAIQVSPQYAFDREHFDRQIQEIEFREWVLEQGRSADRFFERYGIVSDGTIFHREELNIYSFPKPFQPFGTATSDDRCFYGGRCAAEQPYYGEWRKTSEDGRPVMLVSTSTTYVRDADYFKMYISALSALQWHVVLSIGDQGIAEALHPLPPHFEIIQHTAHIKILPHADLFIFLGGTISTAEAIYHGVPLIAVTCGFSEPEWCADTNIVRLGLGLHLKKADTNAENIKKAVARTCEDKQIIENVKQMSRIVRREPGGEDVANKIDEFVEDRCEG